MKEIYIDTSNLTIYKKYPYIYSYYYESELRYEGSLEDPFIVSLRTNKINRWCYTNGTYFISKNNEVFKLVIIGSCGECGKYLIKEYMINIFNLLKIREIHISYLFNHNPYDYKYWAQLLISEFYDINTLDIIHIASVMKEIYKVAGVGHIKNLQEEFSALHSSINDYDSITEMFAINDKFKETIMTSISNVMNNKITKDYLDAYCKLHLKDGIFLGSYKLDVEYDVNSKVKDNKRFDRVHLSFAIKSDREKVREYIKNGNFREEVLRPIFNYNMKGYANLMKMYKATINKYDRLVCSFCFKDEVEKVLSE